MSEREKRTCTCTGTCRGAEGLGENWQCALKSPVPLQPGQEVWVRAEYCGTINGIAIIEVTDIEEDAATVISVDPSSIHPAPQEAKKGE